MSAWTQYEHARNEANRWAKIAAELMADDVAKQRKACKHKEWKTLVENSPAGQGLEMCIQCGKREST